MKYYLVLILIGFPTLSAFQLTQAPDGKKLYEANCQRCHGAEGNKSLFGRGNLAKSKLDDERATGIIQNGKPFMPSFKKQLTKEEIKSLLVFIKSLRK